MKIIKGNIFIHFNLAFWFSFVHCSFYVLVPIFMTDYYWELFETIYFDLCVLQCFVLSFYSWSTIINGPFVFNIYLSLRQSDFTFLISIIWNKIHVFCFKFIFIWEKNIVFNILKNIKWIILWSFHNKMLYT